MSKPTYLSFDCPECGANFDAIPVHYDEDGNGSVDLDATPCAAIACGKLLCAECPQFVCAGCNGVFCPSHMKIVEDGTPEGLRCCAACALDCEEQPAPIPAQRERGLPAQVEVA
jgi:hypothetical protein